jgi:KUP system potassium uptake protein
MMIDTILIAFVLVAWRWSPFRHPLIAHFLYRPRLLSANAIKIPQGGWFPLGVVSHFICLLITEVSKTNVR